MNKPLSAYINFNDNETYQVIYSSQVYGTFFNILALLETKETADGQGYYLINAELKLNVYKGILDLGITRAEFNSPDDDDVYEGGRIKIEIQALYESKPEDLIVTNIDQNQIFPKKQKGKLATGFLKVDRRLKRMNNIVNDANTRSMKNGVFDTAFYYREAPLIGEYKVEDVKPKPAEWDDNYFEKDGLVGPCPRSKMTVI